MNFFKVLTGNVVKWWQMTIMPILRINNDKTGAERFSPNTQQENLHNQVNLQMQGQAVNVQPTNMQAQQQDMAGLHKETISNPTVNDTVGKQGMHTVSGDQDALAIMERINKEKEEARLRQIARAKEKSDEQARIASIMNANKVDVNAFIQAGKDAAEENKTKESEQARKREEDMRRAQEIMERLNREAAEDEAKKQAEIEAARRKAEEQFGG